MPRVLEPFLFSGSSFCCTAVPEPNAGARVLTPAVHTFRTRSSSAMVDLGEAESKPSMTAFFLDHPPAPRHLQPHPLPVGCHLIQSSPPNPVVGPSNPVSNPKEFLQRSDDKFRPFLPATFQRPSSSIISKSKDRWPDLPDDDSLVGKTSLCQQDYHVRGLATEPRRQSFEPFALALTSDPLSQHQKRHLHSITNLHLQI